MKRILTLMLALLLVSGVWAQKQFNWSYNDGKVQGTLSGASHTGKVAFYVPAEVAQLYKGCSVKAVRVGLTNVASNVTVFVTKDLNATPLTSRTQASLKSGWTAIAFFDSYEIDGEGFYVGYEYTGDDCVGLTSYNHANGCWADKGSGWQDYSDESKSLAIQMRVTGTDIPRDLWLNSVDNNTVRAGEQAELTGSVYNLSPYIVRKYQIIYSIDGGAEQTADIKSNFGANMTNQFKIALNDDLKPGTHKVSYRLGLVDDEPDAYEGNNSLEGTLRILSQSPVKRMVVEEGTGTWCGYCPRGTVGMAYMEKKYPDNFIGIAVHKQDKLETSSYSGLVFSGFPNCYVDRRLMFDPNSNALESTWKNMANTIPVAAVNVAATWADNDEINVTTTTTFVNVKNNPNYRLAFVLVENGVKGYTQTNYFSGGSEVMGGFENLPYKAAVDMNHVARQIYGFNGISGSVPSQIENDEPLTYETKLALPSTVQNRDNVKVVALLLDSDTGYIENAAECKVVEPTGINDLSTDRVVDVAISGGQVVAQGFDGTIEVYTLSGVRVANSNLAHGVYVVKLTDGRQSFTKRLAW